ncbi:hypothetical protein ACVWVQ_000670 [Thermostichus sp. MS-CIW-36]
MLGGVLAIAAAIGLVVLLLEAIRYRCWGSVRRWQPAVGLGLVALAALGCWLGQLPDLIPLALLLGGLVGVGLLGLSGCGRAGQGLVVLLLSLAAWQSLAIGSPSRIGIAEQHGMLFLWGCGLGMGLVGIPLLGVLAAAEALSLLMALGQGWSGIAAITWGSRLLEMGSQPDLPWQVLLPVGLAALSLVAGTVPLLTAAEDSPGLLSAVGHGVGWLVALALALALTRNSLYQDPFWALLYGAGVLLSWALLALENQTGRGIPAPGEPAHVSGPEALAGRVSVAEQQGRLLWRACVGLTLVGGGALLALRLGGSYGAALLGLGCLAFPSRWGAMAALFLSARPLLQNLLHQFNLQVAGIDLTQPYVSAALYLGMAAMALAALIHWLYGPDKPLQTGIALTLASLALPVGVGYFIHAQPQAAFLLGALMTALILAALQPILLQQEGRGAESPGIHSRQRDGVLGLALATLAILGSNLSRDWTVTGFHATRLERALVLAGVVGILALILLLWQGWSLWQSRRMRAPARCSR